MNILDDFLRCKDKQVLYLKCISRITINSEFQCTINNLYTLKKTDLTSININNFYPFTINDITVSKSIPLDLINNCFTQVVLLTEATKEQLNIAFNERAEQDILDILNFSGTFRKENEYWQVIEYKKVIQNLYEVTTLKLTSEISKDKTNKIKLFNKLSLFLDLSNWKEKDILSFDEKIDKDLINVYKELSKKGKENE